MTSYSVLPSGPRATVIATWPGEWSDHSAKVTTLTDTDQASELAHALTRLSEGAWDAAAWLDTYPAIEAAIGDLIDQLRSPADKIENIHLAEDGYRHIDQWSFADVNEVLATELPAVIKTLARAQRLTVADELAADAASRAEALRVLRTGQEPAAASRAWQTCEVTRSLRNGQTGPLPEGGAAWLGTGPLAGGALGGPRSTGPHRAIRRRLQGPWRPGRGRRRPHARAPRRAPQRRHGR